MKYQYSIVHVIGTWMTMVSNVSDSINLWAGSRLGRKDWEQEKCTFSLAHMWFSQLSPLTGEHQTWAYSHAMIQFEKVDIGPPL